MQWVGHRDLFTLIRYTDRGIIWLNMLTLFAVCLLPFGSALLSHYNEDPLALRMFGLILIGTSMARTAGDADATGWLVATEYFRIDLRKRVRQGTWKSAGVRGGCQSVVALL
jgi:uncharacterized membrane protein